MEIIEPVHNQFVSHIFVASKKTVRSVINVKKLNHSARYEHFIVEGIHCLMDILTAEDYMVKLDFNDVYFCILVNPNYRKYPRFRWENTLYQFRVAPFGLGQFHEYSPHY